MDEKNPRVATKTSDWSYCTIIGYMPLPLNKVTSWRIKILNSKKNDGNSILVGVAPSDINQNKGNNFEKCGWYLGCWSSILYSDLLTTTRAKSID